LDLALTVLELASRAIGSASSARGEGAPTTACGGENRAAAPAWCSPVVERPSEPGVAFTGGRVAASRRAAAGRVAEGPGTPSAPPEGEGEVASWSAAAILSAEFGRKEHEME